MSGFESLAIPLLSGALGGLGRGGAGKTSLTSQLSATLQANNQQSVSVSNNPTIANIIGAGSGVAPAVSAPVSTPAFLSPSVSAPTSQTATDATPATSSFLPRSNPLGTTGTAPGFINPGSVYRNPNDDMLLLLLIVGAAALLITQ